MQNELFDFWEQLVCCIECEKLDFETKDNKLIYTCNGININKLEYCDYGK